MAVDVQRLAMRTAEVRQPQLHAHLGGVSHRVVGRRSAAPLPDPSEARAGRSGVVVHGLGDSLTAAISDVWTNNRLDPWHEIMVDLLRLAGSDVMLTSQYARSGASSREVLVEQLPDAPIGSGDLVCLWVGGNDVLRSGYTRADSRTAISSIFDAVVDAGGTPLTMELPRISDALPGPAWAMRAWDAQGALVNELTARRSRACGGIHVPWPGAHVTGPDGTHLSQAGHYHYAERYAVELALRWGLEPPVVDLPAGLPVFTARQRWRWYLKHGWLWVVRRRLEMRRQAGPGSPILER